MRVCSYDYGFVTTAKMVPIPSSYTFSPSEATPHLTINHDVAADLDSTNAFEGE